MMAELRQTVIMICRFAFISGVSGTTITGSIDITDGENTVKGTFSAEGEKSVK